MNLQHMDFIYTQPFYIMFSPSVKQKLKQRAITYTKESHLEYGIIIFSIFSAYSKNE